MFNFSCVFTLLTVTFVLYFVNHESYGQHQELEKK